MFNLVLIGVPMIIGEIKRYLRDNNSIRVSRSVRDLAYLIKLKIHGGSSVQVTEKLTKALTETKYLNADNVSRYRCIMRIFFENYEKLNYWLYQEEIYDQMKEDPFFAEYRIEQCQQDLAMLVEWKNLNTIQDTRKVASIEEFKNKKYRYQMSEYSVEIERLVLRLENLSVEGASLEPTLLERIRRNVNRFKEMAKEGIDSDTVYTWWNDLNNDFIRLNQNYKDYMRDLNSVKAEEMMHTREFLVFKDRLVEYLRSFIKGLQQNVGVIEETLRSLDTQVCNQVFEKVIAYELSIPRIDMEVTRELIEPKIRGRFQSIYNWFVSDGTDENEASRLFDETNEIIRKITRYAARITERNASGANRREEYRRVAKLFLNCEDIKDAHKMSAMVFGMERPLHLKGDLVRETDSMNQGVYEEEPFDMTIKPRVRTYKEKTNRSAIRETNAQKQQARQEMIQKQKEDAAKIRLLEKDGRIDFAMLPVIELRVREILLKWLSDAMENPSFQARTEDGRHFRLDKSLVNEKCVVHCEDGNFTMPHMVIEFLEDA